MRILLTFAAAVCIIACQAAQSQITVFAQQNVVHKPLTLESKFGDEGVPDEFLLVKPEGRLAVDEKNNIYVFDEDYIKVYDKSGKPKDIFGGKGEGPGEFPSAFFHSIDISEKGFVSVNMSSYCNVFNPDYKFLKKYYFSDLLAPWGNLLNELNLHKADDGYIYSIDENRMIFKFTAFKEDDKYLETPLDVIAYQNGEETSVIADYENVSIITRMGGSVGSDELGQLFFSILPGERIVYTHGRHDLNIDENGGRYTLHIVDINTGEKSKITHPFIPVALGDSYKRRFQRKVDNDNMKAIQEKGIKLVDEYKYRTPFGLLMTDGDFVFVYYYPESREQRIHADVFNTKEKQYISTVYFYREFMLIKNGYAYFTNIATKEDYFTYIEILNVNPAVYGK